MPHQWIDAMKERGIRVSTINFGAGYVVMDSGVKLPITDYLDEDRCSVPSRDDAAFYEFGSPEAGYAVAPMPPQPAINDWNH